MFEYEIDSDDVCSERGAVQCDVKQLPTSQDSHDGRQPEEEGTG